MTNFVKLFSLRIFGRFAEFWSLILLYCFTVTIIFFLQTYIYAIPVSQKIKIVVLPSKSDPTIDESSLRYFSDTLEEQMSKLRRFIIFPRSDLERILTERNLTELGITEFLKLEQIGAAKYALLLTVSSLNIEAPKGFGSLKLICRYSIKLYDVSNGELILAKTSEAIGEDIDSVQKALGNAIKMASLQIVTFLRKAFQIELRVISVEGKKVVLEVDDSSIIFPGMKFSSSNGNGLVEIKQILSEKIVLGEVISGQALIKEQKLVEFVSEDPDELIQWLRTVKKPLATIGLSLDYNYAFSKTTYSIYSDIRFSLFYENFELVQPYISISKMLGGRDYSNIDFGLCFNQKLFDINFRFLFGVNHWMIDLFGEHPLVYSAGFLFGLINEVSFSNLVLQFGVLLRLQYVYIKNLWELLQMLQYWTSYDFLWIDIVPFIGIFSRIW